jgi:hypothetical protein
MRPARCVVYMYQPDDVVGVAAGARGGGRGRGRLWGLRRGATAAVEVSVRWWCSLHGNAGVSEQEGLTWAGQAKPRPPQQWRQRGCAQPALARSQQSWYLMIPAAPVPRGDDDAAPRTSCRCCSKLPSALVAAERKEAASEAWCIVDREREGRRGEGSARR